MTLPKYARPVLVVALSTLISIAAGYALSVSVFAATSILAVLALTVGLSMGAFALLAVVTIAVCWSLRISDPGYLMHTVFGTIAGTAAVEIIGLLFPGFVVGSILGVAAFSLVNTVLIWGVAAGTKSLRPSLKFLPTFEARS